jgi:hypothetical protein
MWVETQILNQVCEQDRALTATMRSVSPKSFCWSIASRQAAHASERSVASLSRRKLRRSWLSCSLDPARMCSILSPSRFRARGSAPLRSNNFITSPLPSSNWSAGIRRILWNMLSPDSSGSGLFILTSELAKYACRVSPPWKHAWHSKQKRLPGFYNSILTTYRSCKSCSASSYCLSV